MTSRTLALAFGLTAGLTAAAPPAFAGDVQGDAYDCRELWRMRNQIYKSGGLCFKSPKAIAEFGSAGCTHDGEAETLLSDVARDTLAQIRKSERRQGCR